LRITITNINNATGEVSFDVTMIDNNNDYYTTGNNGRGFLGQRFYYDNSSSYTYSTRVYETSVFPPALSLGDGYTIPYTLLDFVSATESGSSPYSEVPTVAKGLTTFRGSFSHTYAAAGNYTITAFAPDAYGTTFSPSLPGVVPKTFTTGNAVGTTVSTSASNLAGAARGGEIGSETPYGVTNTAQVAIGNVLAVPAANEWGLLLLGLAIGVGGLLVLRSAR